MANNRLYLVDTETYEYIMLAKGWSSGWSFWEKTPIGEFLESDNTNAEPRDFRAAGMFDGSRVTKLALFTEANLPKECGDKTWAPKRAPKRAAGKD
jgi:hypothetical protein